MKRHYIDGTSLNIDARQQSYDARAAKRLGGTGHRRPDSQDFSEHFPQEWLRKPALRDPARPGQMTGC
jgi:hypothetical protein